MPMRLATLVALALAGTGCGAPYMKHQRFDAQYRDAVAIAVLPPRYSPEFVCGSTGCERDKQAYAVIVNTIQDELERRHFEVAWVHDTPDCATAITQVSNGLDGLMPRLLEAYAPTGADGRRPATFHAMAGDVGPILDAFSSDLLLVVEAGGASSLAWTEISPEPGVLPKAFIRVLLLDRTGEVVFFSSIADGTDIYAPKQAMGFVRRAMEPLPGH
jgi:hypothetical protein